MRYFFKRGRVHGQSGESPDPGVSSYKAHFFLPTEIKNVIEMFDLENGFT